MIRLIDLLQACNDSMILNIFNNECDLISRYDGRDSIDDNLKNEWVEWIYPTMDNQLNVGLA